MTVHGLTERIAVGRRVGLGRRTVLTAWEYRSAWLWKSVLAPSSSYSSPSSDIDKRARDSDCTYGKSFIRRLRAIGIRDRPTAPRSPWQNAYVERLIGSIRRELLDHVVVLGERHLRHLLLSYMTYHDEARTHLSLNKDAAIVRSTFARRFTATGGWRGRQRRRPACSQRLSRSVPSAIPICAKTLPTALPEHQSAAFCFAAAL
jgi:transposase InsO family protein